MAWRCASTATWRVEPGVVVTRVSSCSTRRLTVAAYPLTTDMRAVCMTHDGCVTNFKTARATHRSSFLRYARLCCLRFLLEHKLNEFLSLYLFISIPTTAASPVDRTANENPRRVLKSTLNRINTGTFSCEWFSFSIVSSRKSH